MEDYIKKYVWVTGVAVVLLCTLFAGRATSHVLEAWLLADSAKPAPPEPPYQPRPARHAAARSKAGEPLVERNMFCSDCPLPGEEPTEEQAEGEDGEVPLTRLPLELLATNIASKDRHSFATIRNTSTERQGAYWINSVIPEAGPVLEIAGRHVTFRNESSQRLERIALLANSPMTTPAPPRPAVARPMPRPAPGGTDDLMAAVDAGIRKVDDTHYELDRSVVDRVLANPFSVTRGARIVPSIRNGKADGFKLYAIRSTSVYHKLGLENGDTLHGVNGFEISSPDKGLEVYNKVKEASNISLSITRRGKPITLNYAIR